ncbi:GAF domain-containing protein [Nocardia sp. NPDC003482]
MWYLVDATDAAKVIRHVPEEGMARERLLHRAIRPNSLALLAESVLERTIVSGERVARDLRVRGEDFQVLALPVPGPDDQVLAVQLRVARRADPPEPPPAVDAFTWDGPQWTLMSGGAGGAVLPAGYERLHGAWFLSRIVECEERDKLMTAALTPRPGTVWEGPMRVLTADDTHTTRVFGYFRYHGDEALRGLLLQVESDRVPGIVQPTYHNDAAAALLGGTTALIDTERLQIIEWLTPPLPEIAWRHHPASRGLDPVDRDEFNLGTTHLIHPEDMGFYVRGLTDLARGAATEARGIVRLLTLRGDWRTVELYCIRLPHGLPRFLICLIRPVPDAAPGLITAR